MSNGQWDESRFLNKEHMPSIVCCRKVCPIKAEWGLSLVWLGEAGCASWRSNQMEGKWRI